MSHFEHVRSAAFFDELEKLAYEDAYARRLADPSWRADPVNPEGMTKRKWMQTAIDLPIVIGSQALGYGIGRTAAEIAKKRALKTMGETGVPPAWVKHVPLGMSILSGIGSYALGRAHDTMKERREQAERTGKVVLK